MAGIADQLADLFSPPAKQMGSEDALRQWGQQSRLNYPQQAAQYGMLAQGMRNMFQPQPSFEPIKNEYMRAYREGTMPGMLSNFTGNMGGGDFQRAVAQGDVDLATRLAGLQANFQQHQSDKGREFATNLLNTGMRPSVENVYSHMPYDAARQYLEKQGTTNPSPQQIQEVMPMFQTQPSLGQAVYNKAQPIASELQQGYKQGGFGGLKNEASRILSGKPAPLSGPGVVTNKEQFFQQHPQTAAKIESNLTNATPDQKSAADWVIAHKRAAMPLLEQNLTPQDYTLMRSIMENPSPAVNRFAYTASSKKELDEFSKVMATNNLDKIKKYLKRKYGIVEE